MADASLDEIIKQKRLQRFGNKRQNNKMNNQGKGRPMANQNRKFVQQDFGSMAKKNVSLTTDARNRIIQKQRGKFSDARDRLAQLAKRGDARDKLNKIRTNPTQIRKINHMGAKKAIPAQKPAVVKKQIINVPKQTLKASGQTRMKGNALLRTVAGGNVRKNVGNKGNTVLVKKVVQHTQKSQRTGQLQRTGRPQFTVKNQLAVRGRQNIAQLYDDTYTDVTDSFRNEIQIVPRTQPYGGGMAVPSVETVFMTRQEPLIRGRPVQTVIYEPEYEPEIRPQRMRITAANPGYRIGSQTDIHPQAWNQPRTQPARAYDEQVEYQVYPKKVTTLSAARPPADRGTKVVVSNLHPNVSVEDMEELFGTVGQLSSVRMVRQGVAEAMFVNQQDAYRSVDMFNNRQLDGLPMKVVVVKTKTPLLTTSNVQARSVLKSARGRTGNYV